MDKIRQIPKDPDWAMSYGSQTKVHGLILFGRPADWTKLVTPRDGDSISADGNPDILIL